MTAQQALPRPTPRPRQRQMPEEVAGYVRELIISGAVRPGEFLRMDRVAEALGVSNTPVREGLLTLRSEGYVRQIPRRGFMVLAFARQDITDLFWSQARLAGELAARAASNISAEQLAVLEGGVNRYPSAVERHDDQAVALLGHAFHREINLASGSTRLALLLGSVTRQLPNSFYAMIEGHVHATRDEHPLILEALRAQDPRRSRALMQEHIFQGADRLIGMLEARGQWSTESRD